MSDKNTSRSTGADGTSVLLPLLAGALAAGLVVISRSVRKDRQAGIERSGRQQPQRHGQTPISASKAPQDTRTAQIRTVAAPADKDGA